MHGGFTFQNLENLRYSRFTSVPPFLVKFSSNYLSILSIIQAVAVAWSCIALAMAQKVPITSSMLYEAASRCDSLSRLLDAISSSYIKQETLSWSGSTLC